jgi:hypothetical protein
MAGSWFAHGALLLSTGGLDWPDDITAEFIIAVLTTSAYVPSKANDQYLSDISHELVDGVAGYERLVLTSGTATIITDGGNTYILLDAADLVWHLATFTARNLIIAKLGTTDADSPVLCYHVFKNDSTGLPEDKTGGGDDFTYKFTATGGVARLKC